MRKDKATWVILFSGILLMVSYVMLGTALFTECMNTNGTYKMQKVLVYEKKQNNANNFSVDDITKLKKELGTQDLSFSAKSGLAATIVSSGRTSLQAELIGTDSMYPLFNRLELSKGCFFTENQVDEGELAAVIEDSLAEELFHTTDVIGKTIEILNKVFHITGVFKKDDSIIGKLTDNGLPVIIIPAPVLLELDTTAKIDTVSIKAADTGILEQNKSDISSALQQIGKNPLDYNISDFNMQKALIKQVPLLFVFILGARSIFILLKYIKIQTLRIYRLLKEGCRTDYFSNVIRSLIPKIGIFFIKFFIALAGACLILYAIRFKFLIPPKFIPDELINLSYYSGLIKSTVQTINRNSGNLIPRPEQALNICAVIENVFFCISSVLGFFLINSGLNMIAGKTDFDILVKRAGIFFGMALVVSAIAAFLLGLPFVPDTKGILVAWAFLFLNITYINNEKESEAVLCVKK